MKLGSDVDLNLGLMLDGVDDFTAEEVLEMELAVMATVAALTAGGEHMVVWEPSERYQ